MKFSALVLLLPAVASAKGLRMPNPFTTADEEQCCAGACAVEGEEKVSVPDFMGEQVFSMLCVLDSCHSNPPHYPSRFYRSTTLSTLATTFVESAA